MRFPVDLHTHTVACSHAFSTIGEYLTRAREMGLMMFATTDHGPALADGAHRWHFGNLKVLPRLWEGVALLRGVEANVMEEGGIDLGPRERSRLDLVLCGFHENFRSRGAEGNTEAIKAIIASGEVDIITHLGNPAYPIIPEEVLRCALVHQVAIEINATSGVNSRPGSHGNCVELARLCARLGNVVSLGSDAHIHFSLGNFEEAERVIGEAGLPDAQIINRDPLAVLEFLKGRGHDPAPLAELWERFSR
ncbi:MAG: PHP domain-containing protein [Succinivibrionaceae bacterium]|nr:PHP domain-containing protein [Succinivibrionaceae bacterium]